MKRFGCWMALIVAVCTGCRNYNYKYDNPGVRALQAESLAVDVSAHVGGQSLDEFFGPRTDWILPDTSVLVRGDSLEPGTFIELGGRAAAISKDGYYLTASHCVEGANPVIVLPPTFGREAGVVGSIGDQRVLFSMGRVVKYFRPADVALVKFEHRPSACFTSFLENPAPGLEVFTGSTVGYVIGQDKLGNGPFRVRGEVLRIEGLGASYTRIQTTIVGRGGMSGAAVTDGEGNLVGILVQGRWSRLTRRPRDSEIQIASTAEILAAMEADRRASPGPDRQSSVPR